jgi:hypothetical protein
MELLLLLEEEVSSSSSSSSTGMEDNDDDTSSDRCCSLCRRTHCLFRRCLFNRVIQDDVCKMVLSKEYASSFSLSLAMVLDILAAVVVDDTVARSRTTAQRVDMNCNRMVPVVVYWYGTVFISRRLLYTPNNSLCLYRTLCGGGRECVDRFDSFVSEAFVGSTTNCVVVCLIDTLRLSNQCVLRLSRLLSRPQHLWIQIRL